MKDIAGGGRGGAGMGDRTFMVGISSSVPSLSSANSYQIGT